MSKISCDVTKDLLPCYLDEICSEESKELVVEHLAECAECRDFMKQLQEQDLGKDAPKVDFMKKTRLMEFRSIIGFVVALIACFLIGDLCKEIYGSAPYVFYYVAMPILMMTYTFALFDVKRQQRLGKKDRIILVLTALLVCAAVGLRWLAINWIKVGSLLQIPYNKMGSYVYLMALLIILAGIVLLLVQFVRAKREGQFSLISQNLAWFGVYLALTFIELLREMVETEYLFQMMMQDAGILGVEFIVVTVGMILIMRKK